ncbi:prephenate dehydratase [Salinifilum aidingensis]
MPQIGFLGPWATFSEQAVHAMTERFPTGFDTELVPYETVPLALRAVRAGEVSAAGVPVENSVEGAVPATLDSLVTGEPVVSVAEVTLPVRFDVLARPGLELGTVRSVASHPHALAQVRGWLGENLPDAEVRPAASTAAAAASVQAGEVDAAISAPLAAQHYSGVERLAEGVADVQDALTRFLLVRRPGSLPEPTGADRTSVAAVIGDEVGSLAEMLAEFALRGINLSRIESRPTKDRLGEYRFFLDFDGHVADARIGDVLTALRRRCSEVRFLGSYPRADREPTSVRPADSEQAFRQSRQWLEEVRAGRRA